MFVCALILTQKLKTYNDYDFQKLLKASVNGGEVCPELFSMKRWKEGVLCVLTKIIEKYIYETQYSLENTTCLDQLLVAALMKLDRDTFAHSLRTQKLALIVGERVGLLRSELLSVSLGALLHDIGKAAIPVHVLQKVDPLTSQEWDLLKTHPVKGYYYIEQTDLDDTVKRIVLHHHVWMNGRAGYPLGMDSKAPCPLTQIVTIADVIDAMTSARPYRPAFSLSQLMDHLESGAGTQFNRDLVKVFQDLVHNL